jgi:hypothetical protein
MAIEFSSEATASVALSLVLGLFHKLIADGVIRKEDAVKLFDDVEKAKDAKSILYHSHAESEAATLVAGLRDRL